MKESIPIRLPILSDMFFCNRAVAVELNQEAIHAIAIEICKVLMDNKIEGVIANDKEEEK